MQFVATFYRIRTATLTAITLDIGLFLDISAAQQNIFGIATSSMLNFIIALKVCVHIISILIGDDALYRIRMISIYLAAHSMSSPMMRHNGSDSSIDIDSPNPTEAIPTLTPNCNKKLSRTKRRNLILCFSDLLAKMRCFWLLILQNLSNGEEFMHRLRIC